MSDEGSYLKVVVADIGKPIIIQCAWCNKYASSDGEWVEANVELDGFRVSHGICPTCHAKVCIPQK